MKDMKIEDFVDFMVCIEYLFYDPKKGQDSGYMGISTDCLEFIQLFTILKQTNVQISCIQLIILL